MKKDERIERLDDLSNLIKKGSDNLTKEEREYVKKTLEQVGFSLAEDMVKRNPKLKLEKNGLISMPFTYPRNES
ncbi:hypothetical protein LCGC14_1933850 [marine sediment metagenome]|uniref:Uncharacterized protein n=1 Tax=marine sediment metagenome TaxID=412755 RepID=A0A0F9I0X3_9ZZZZ